MSGYKGLVVFGKRTIKHHKNVVVFCFKRIHCAIPLPTQDRGFFLTALSSPSEKTRDLPFVLIRIVIAFELRVDLADVR